MNANHMFSGIAARSWLNVKHNAQRIFNYEKAHSIFKVFKSDEREHLQKYEVILPDAPNHRSKWIEGYEIASNVKLVYWDTFDQYMVVLYKTPIISYRPGWICFSNGDGKFNTITTINRINQFYGRAFIQHLNGRLVTSVGNRFFHEYRCWVNDKTLSPDTIVRPVYQFDRKLGEARFWLEDDAGLVIGNVERYRIKKERHQLSYDIKKLRTVWEDQTVRYCRTNTSRNAMPSFVRFEKSSYKSEHNLVGKKVVIVGKSATHRRAINETCEGIVIDYDQAYYEGNHNRPIRVEFVFKDGLKVRQWYTYGELYIKQD